jgi:hypothetical protein
VARLLAALRWCCLAAWPWPPYHASGGLGAIRLYGCVTCAQRAVSVGSTLRGNQVKL